MYHIYRKDNGIWQLSVVVYNASDTSSPNSNVLDKKQHFRIILNLETKGKKYENNPALGVCKIDFQHTLFPSSL